LATVTNERRRRAKIIFHSVIVPRNSALRAINFSARCLFVSTVIDHAGSETGYRSQ
jgi:hypothetical protein